MFASFLPASKSSACRRSSLSCRSNACFARRCLRIRVWYRSSMRSWAVRIISPPSSAHPSFALSKGPRTFETPSFSMGSGVARPIRPLLPRKNVPDRAISRSRKAINASSLIAPEFARKQSSSSISKPVSDGRVLSRPSVDSMISRSALANVVVRTAARAGTGVPLSLGSSESTTVSFATTRTFEALPNSKIEKVL